MYEVLLVRNLYFNESFMKNVNTVPPDRDIVMESHTFHFCSTSCKVSMYASPLNTYDKVPKYSIFRDYGTTFFIGWQVLFGNFVFLSD
jgi:hypothetical protein